MIFGKNYNLIQFQDIERLVNNKIPESKTLDYKKEINIEKGDERKEFLYDVASFANSDGGVIIYGVSETKDINNQNTGIPDELCGLTISNFDKLIQKIEDLIMSSIEPNIPNLLIRHLSNGNKNLLFISIPKPIGLPRMVTYNGSNKFYKRRNTGKYLPDVFELNQLFMSNYEIFQQIEEHRQKRVKVVKSLEFVNDIILTNMTFLHIVPISFYTYSQLPLLDDSFIEKIKTSLRPIGAQSYDSRYNFEGYQMFERNFSEGTTEAYTQVFRNGIIEFFTHSFHSQNNMGKDSFQLGWFEIAMIDCVRSAIEIYRNNNIQPPFIVQITILDLLERFIDTRGAYNTWHFRFMSNDLFVPNIMIQDYDVDIAKEMKVPFDMIWQSAGCKQSPYYNAAGSRLS